VARALDGCPAADDAVLGVSELASNAIRHSRSGQGGRFQVLVWRGHVSACVAVIDDGARRGPAPRAHGPGELAESGHGLRVVVELAANWGHQDLAPSGDSGQIPFRKVGRRRRITFEALMEYKRKDDLQRRAAAHDLADLGQELGLD
jgi:Histidine kinase-like ATPase domain